MKDEIANIAKLGERRSKTIRAHLRLNHGEDQGFEMPSAQQIQNELRANDDYKLDWDGDIKTLKDVIRKKGWDQDGSFLVVREKPFLVLRMTKFMQMLLMRYGHKSMVFLDSTHGICKYKECSLFYLGVKTNEGYKIVAMFMTNRETQETVVEALQLIKEQNPDFKPEVAMVDYCGAEISSFLDTWPAERAVGDQPRYRGIEVWICQTHRERAWMRNLVKRFGRTEDYDTALRMLREIASAQEIDQADAAWLKLKQHELWSRKMTKMKKGKMTPITNLQQWIDNKWGDILIRKMWQVCYRKRLRIIPCHTTNGSESFNSVTKNVTDLNGHDKIYQVCQKLFEIQLPDEEKKYWRAQKSAGSLDMGHRPDEKEYLINVPNRFYRDCKRISKFNNAHERQYGATEVKKMARSSYHVCSGIAENAPHLVEVHLPRCDCYTFWKRRYLCPHLVKLLDREVVKWEELPATYRDHPYFNLNEDNAEPSEDPCIYESNSVTARPATPVDEDDDMLEEDEFNPLDLDINEEQESSDDDIDEYYEIKGREKLESSVALLNSYFYHPSMFSVDNEEAREKLNKMIEDAAEFARNIVGARL